MEKQKHCMGSVWRWVELEARFPGWRKNNNHIFACFYDHVLEGKMNHLNSVLIEGVVQRISYGTNDHEVVDCKLYLKSDYHIKDDMEVYRQFNFNYMVKVEGEAAALAVERAKAGVTIRVIGVLRPEGNALCISTDTIEYPRAEPVKAKSYNGAEQYHGKSKSRYHGD